MKTIHEKVHPLAVVMVHRLVDDHPCILFIKQNKDGLWSPIFDHVRPKEQPYNAGLRALNNTLDLNLKNVRLRCYFANTIYGEIDTENTIAVYYTLKLRDDEVGLLDRMLDHNVESMKFDRFKWVSVHEPNIDGDVFDGRMAYCWETMRKAVASNYNVKVSK